MRKDNKVKWGAALVALGALVVAAEAMGQDPSARTLTGRYWKAIELMGRPSPAIDVKRDVYLQFDADGRVAGLDGCNRVTGRYEVKGDALTIGPLAGTRMACPGTDALTEAFRKAVAATTRWRTVADRLELLDGDGVVVARFAARIDAPGAGAGQEASTIAGTAWQLVRFQGGDDSVATPDDRSKYTLRFDTDGRVAVRFDCNRGTGNWTSSSPGQLQFGPLAVTRAMCPPASLHDRMVKHWPYVRSYVLRGGHLFLSLAADGGIYEFEPIATSK